MVLTSYRTGGGLHGHSAEADSAAKPSPNRPVTRQAGIQRIRIAWPSHGKYNPHLRSPKHCCPKSAKCVPSDAGSLDKDGDAASPLREAISTKHCSFAICVKFVIRACNCPNG